MSDTLRYEVVVEGNDNEGYSAFLPSLLGCVSAADTIEEIQTLIVEAVAFHIEGMVEDGLSLPDPIPPELWEEEFGMPIPESVVPGMFVEISPNHDIPTVSMKRVRSIDVSTFNVGNRVSLHQNPNMIGMIIGKQTGPSGVKYRVNFPDIANRDWYTGKDLALSAPEFEVGNQVSPRQTPNRVGFIAQQQRRQDGNVDYLVFFGASEQEWYGERSLVAAVPVDDTPRATEGSKFLRDMALIKLRSNLSDTLYSYRASRTKVEPYQFKPAIKFFESANQRLLIADEVGLGKTIEAGIILLELKARVDMKRVLVVCPSSLRYKWRDEMMNRFSEEFVVLNSSGFREHLDRYANYGNAIGLKAIVSMETIRQRGIAELVEETGFMVDLVIIDEAHHMRNASTLTHRIGRVLSDVSGSLLMLSATPIQLRSADLFNLFRILDEGQFDSLEEFEQLREPNIHINDASRMLSTDADSYPQSLETLRRVEDSIQKDRYLANPLYLNVCERLESATDLGYKDLVQIQRDLQQLNTFAPMFNRTTKRDVSPGVRRTPYVLEVQLSQEEQEFYDSFLEFLKSQSTSILAVIQRERAAASCIPAAKDYIMEVIADNQVSLEMESSTPDLLDEDTSEFEADLSELRVVSENLGEKDSKYETFVQAMDSLCEESPNTKVLVFAFFRRTLEYLRSRLNHPDSPYAGSVYVIHGGIEQAERPRIIEKFRQEPGFGILLLSEVGAEGMDFQFSDTVFNYDLPWNPMRVEQRIGRVDRYGQESERIRVYSLVLNDTIEERILGRLYKRIRVFQESIGDLEAILGEEISKLQREVFQSHLTPEQEEERAEATLMSVEFKRTEMASFQENQDRLMGQDIIFQQQFDEMKDGGKFVSDAEIRALVDEFIKEACPTSSLRSRKGSLFTLRATRDLQGLVLRTDRSGRFPPAIMAPLREKMQNAQGFPVTFDGELALQRPLLELINLQHPLVQAARDHFESDSDVPPLLRLGSAKAKTINPDLTGEYGFFIYHIRGTGVERLSSLVPIVIDLETGRRVEGVETDLMSSLQGANFENHIPNGFDWRELEALSRDYFGAHRDFLQAEMETRNNAVIDTRIAGLRQTSTARVNRWRETLERVEETNIRRMRRAQISNEEIRLQSEIDELESKRGVDVSGSLVLAGYIRYNQAAAVQSSQ